jgi:hypothetical protein
MAGDFAVVAVWSDLDADVCRGNLPRRDGIKNLILTPVVLLIFRREEF